jgi:hypothetical protein
MSISPVSSLSAIYGSQQVQNLPSPSPKPGSSQAPVDTVHPSPAALAHLQDGGDADMMGTANKKRSRNPLPAAKLLTPGAGRLEIANYLQQSERFLTRAGNRFRQPFVPSVLGNAHDPICRFRFPL